MPVNIVVIFNNKFIRVRDVRVGISQNTFKLLCPSALGFKFYETSIIVRSENDRVKTLKEFIWCASTSGCFSLSITLSMIFGHHVRPFALIFESILFLWYWHILFFNFLTDRPKNEEIFVKRSKHQLYQNWNKILILAIKYRSQTDQTLWLRCNTCTRKNIIKMVNIGNKCVWNVIIQMSNNHKTNWKAFKMVLFFGNGKTREKTQTNHF